MMKAVLGFVAGLLLVSLVGWQMAPSLMFTERVSPFGMEETVARIQQNIQNTGNGWALSGLRNPAKAVQSDGGNVLPVMMIEACSTKYSKPILKDDTVRFLSILMPCKISVYKKNDGKVYIGTMNAGLMGKLFGPLVGEVMGKVAEDQKKFVVFDPKTPAPKMIMPAPPAGATPGGSGGGGGGC
ncbi:MAG TPA: DUF302 domain-containing protein [Thiobacillaceae bacterium]|nr:DUF302 domain-containing protein [Thiobacillaceae bacterium]HNF87771.1 DUF302 domain-containing protein [Thiobacillaceae bacterium]HNH89235.1 DUF302 domain-containing protein [Thiobacillaceae bacterium]HNI06585.1 DUF302 domain-containing protein [Thiobacillaceae bacterium]